MIPMEFLVPSLYLRRSICLNRNHVTKSDFKNKYDLEKPLMKIAPCLNLTNVKFCVKLPFYFLLNSSVVYLKHE